MTTASVTTGVPPSPEDVLLHKDLAAKALQQGDTEGACGHYETALGMAATILSTKTPLPPTSSSTLEATLVTKELVGILFANASLCHFKLGRFEEALRDALDATKIHPRYVKGYYRAAQAHTALHEFKEAEGMVAKGLVYTPNSAELKELKKEIKMVEKLARIEASRAGELGAVRWKGRVFFF
jgi:tetratricopeptide (TPR) repeat protein